MKKEIIETKKKEYVIVPAAWFERLLEIANKGEKDKQFLIGYVSSAETILKYSKRVEE